MAEKINTIDEALAVLEDAAKDKKEELTKQIGGRYQHVREIFSGSPRRMVRDAFRKEKIDDAIKKGRYYAEQSMHTMDDELHRHPLPYLLGTAVTFLIIGYTLSGNGKKH